MFLDHLFMFSFSLISHIFHFFIFCIFHVTGEWARKRMKCAAKCDTHCEWHHRCSEPVDSWTKVERILLRCLLSFFGTCHVWHRVVCFRACMLQCIFRCIALAHVSWWCSTCAWLRMVWTVHGCRWTFARCTLGHRESLATAKKWKSCFALSCKDIKYRSRSARFCDPARVKCSSRLARMHAYFAVLLLPTSTRDLQPALLYVAGRSFQRHADRRTQTDAEKHRRTQTDTDGHRQTQTDTDVRIARNTCTWRWKRCCLHGKVRVQRTVIFRVIWVKAFVSAPERWQRLVATLACRSFVSFGYRAERVMKPPDVSVSVRVSVRVRFFFFLSKSFFFKNNKCFTFFALRGLMYKNKFIAFIFIFQFVPFFNFCQISFTSWYPFFWFFQLFWFWFLHFRILFFHFSSFSPLWFQFLFLREQHAWCFSWPALCNEYIAVFKTGLFHARRAGIPRRTSCGFVGCIRWSASIGFRRSRAPRDRGWLLHVGSSWSKCTRRWDEPSTYMSRRTPRPQSGCAPERALERPDTLKLLGCGSKTPFVTRSCAWERWEARTTKPTWEPKTSTDRYTSALIAEIAAQANPVQTAPGLDRDSKRRERRGSADEW